MSTTTAGAASIGLIGGLGVGAAMHYYRELHAAFSDRRPLDLVMVHASITRAMRHAADGDRDGLARYLAGLLGRVKAGGATIGVVPAVTPHVCIEELKAITPLPVVDLTVAVSQAIAKRKLTRIALFGTRFVVESDMYGRLSGVEIVRPQPAEIAMVHDGYTRLATSGTGTAADREPFVRLADTLRRRDGVEAIALAGTDFAVIFDEATTPFPHIDCAQAHIDAIARTVDQV